MDKSLALALTVYGIGAVISFFVVLLIKVIFASLQIPKYFKVKKQNNG